MYTLSSELIGGGGVLVEMTVRFEATMESRRLQSGAKWREQALRGLGQ